MALFWQSSLSGSVHCLICRLSITIAERLKGARKPAGHYNQTSSNHSTIGARLLTQKEEEELINASKTLGLSNGLLRDPYRETLIDRNHGRGLLAGCNIPRGALILEKAPFFSISNCTDPLNTSKCGPNPSPTETKAQFGGHPTVHVTSEQQVNLLRFDASLQMTSKWTTLGVSEASS